MNWQRLDRDTTLKVIDSVKSAADAGLFAPGTSEVQRARLSFYGPLSLYKLTNFASLPSFTFEYLGDGVFFKYLDGTEEPIYAMNDKGHLTLNDRSVVDYLDFFLSHVTVDDDEMFLIQNPHDMPQLDSLDPGDAAIVVRNHTPAKIDYDGGYDKYTVETDLYSEGQLLRAIIEISGNGRVTVTSRRMIVNAVAHSFGSEIMV